MLVREVGKEKNMGIEDENHNTEQLIEEAITTTQSPSSPRPSYLSSGADINSIHKEDKALIDLLGADEIPLELGLVFLPPEIQRLYQEHQVV